MFSWESDLDTETPRYSPNAEQVLDFAAARNIAEYLSLLHPESRDAGIFQYRRTVASKYRFDKECRVCNPINNQILWIRAQGVPIDGSRGTLTRVVGTRRILLSPSASSRNCK
jgi:hypothetical protein